MLNGSCNVCRLIEPYKHFDIMGFGETSHDVIFVFVYAPHEIISDACIQSTIALARQYVDIVTLHPNRIRPWCVSVDHFTTRPLDPGINPG